MSSSDPVHIEDGAWYFYDECWVGRYGPFETRQQAEDELFVYCVLNEMLPKELPEDDDGIRAWWRKQGGRFHGPKVETGKMPEDQLLPALRKVFSYTNRLAKQCARLVSQTHPRPAGEQLRGRDSEVVTFDEPGGLTVEQLREGVEIMRGKGPTGRTECIGPEDQDLEDT